MAGWQFKLSSDLAQTQDILVTPATTGTSTTAEYSVMLSDLPQALQDQAVNGQLWVSEVEQDGYDFIHLRCHNNGAYGDNLEEISLDGQTPSDVYCIAYNMTGGTSGQPGDTISGTKFNDADGNGQHGDGEAGLSGFSIVAVDQSTSFTYTVNANDADGSSNPVPAGEYLIVASGTWQGNNDSNSAIDAEYTTDDTWSTHGDGSAGYPEAGVNQGDLMINNAFGNWGPYMGSHTYAMTYTHGGGSLTFTVFDGDATTGTPNNAWYADNSGSLTVTLYKVVASDVTDSNGNYELHIGSGNAAGNNVVVYEIQQDGFTQTFPSGNGTHSIDLSSNTTFSGIDFGNRRGSVLGDTDSPNLHFIKVVCDSYSNFAGNESSTTYDDTNGNYEQFTNYNGGAFTPSTLVNGMVSPSEISDGCERMNNWQFKVSAAASFDGNHYVHSGNTQIIGPTANGEFMTEASGDNSVLDEEFQDAAINGLLWVSEVPQEGYDFGALRCYEDALNGDNLEAINLHANVGDGNPSDVYCIAYNIQKDTEEPCVDMLDIVSGVDTDTAGFTETNPQANPLNPTLYNDGSFDNAIAANTQFPYWVDPATATNLSGTGAVWVSTAASHPGEVGGEGDPTHDQWRLFRHTFTVPSDSSPQEATLYFTADNAVTVYLNGTPIAVTPNLGTYTPTPGSIPNEFGTVYSTTFTPTEGINTLAFVVRNSSTEASGNPTGLVYAATVQFDCDDDNGGGNNGGGGSSRGGGGSSRSNSVSGVKYNDANFNGTRDNGEDGLSGWVIYLDANDNNVRDDDEEFDTTDSDGDYRITKVDSGDYAVREEAQSGWNQFEPGAGNNFEYSITMTKSSDFDNLDFGNAQGAVLGDVTNTPSNIDRNAVGGDNTNPRVLGDSDELPRTGLPLSWLVMMALLGTLPLVGRRVTN